MSETFRALVADQVDGKVRADFRDLTAADLPDGDVTVRVSFSTLNYKDGLAVSGKGMIARQFPMVCGIDLAGTIEESSHPDYRPGDEVILTGWGLSETHPGGYTQRQRVRGEWLVPLPAGLTLQQSMAIGTAGFTAMLSVMALEHMGVAPGEHEVVVSGAAGGVGSVAVAVLAKLGYTVAASTGRPEAHPYLRSLGATTMIDRAELATDSKRPLESERWAGAVDTVGDQTLATILRQTRRAGAVASCGLAGGPNLPTTVFPFILRGVSLLGIDSVMCPGPKRREAWRRLTQDLPLDKLDAMTSVEPLSRVPELADHILAGQTRGRVVIDVNA